MWHGGAVIGGSGFEPHQLACFLSGYSNFVPQSKDMQVSLMGDSELPMSVNGCSGPGSVLGVPASLPASAWIGSGPQQPK